MTLRDIGLCAAIVVIAAVVRLPAIGDSLWLDEIYSVHFVQRPIDSLLQEVREVDTHPPLYYLLLHLWLRLGDSDAWVRVPSVLAGIGTALFACAAAWTISGRSAGIGAGLIVALSPRLVFLSLEARNYSLMILWVAAAMYLFARILRSDGGRLWDWLLAGLAQGLAMLTFYYAAFFIAGANLLLTLEAIRTRGRTVRPGPLVASWIVAAAVFAPWLPGFRQQLEYVGTSDAGLATEHLLPTVARVFTQMEPFALVHRLLSLAMVPSAMLVAAMIVAAIVALALRRLLASHDGLRLRWFALVAGTAAFAILFAPLMAWCGGSFVSSRYFGHVDVLGALMAVVVVGALVTGDLKRKIAVGLVCIALVPWIPGHAWRPKEPWRQAAAFVDERTGSGDAIIGLNGDPFAYRHYGESPADDYAIPFDVPGVAQRAPDDWLGALNEEHLPFLRELLRQYDRVVLILSHTRRSGRDRGEPLLRDLLTDEGYALRERHSFEGGAGVRVEVYERSSSSYASLSGTVEAPE